MDTKSVSLRIPTDALNAIDAEAEADHRDRSSMFRKIIAFYFDHHSDAPQTRKTIPPPNGKTPQVNPTKNKKVGSR